MAVLVIGGSLQIKLTTITGSAEFDSIAAKQVDESTIEGTLKRAGKAAATTSRTLSKDKKTMTVTTQGKNRDGQAMHNVLVFDRQ